MSIQVCPLSGSSGSKNPHNSPVFSYQGIQAPDLVLRKQWFSNVAETADEMSAKIVGFDEGLKTTIQL